MVYRDDHGQSFLIKSDFCDGLIEFFRSQKPIQRDVGVTEVAIAVESDNAYHDFLLNESPPSVISK